MLARGLLIFVRVHSDFDVGGSIVIVSFALEAAEDC